MYHRSAVLIATHTTACSTFQALWWSGFAALVIATLLFGLWGGSFASHLESHIASDCPTPEARYAMESATDRAAMGGWMGFSTSVLLCIVWGLLYGSTRSSNDDAGAYWWYRHLLMIILASNTALQSLGAGLVAGAGLRPTDDVWSDLGCTGTFSKCVVFLWRWCVCT